MTFRGKPRDPSRSMLEYARRLTLDPGSVSEADLGPMRAAGMSLVIRDVTMSGS